MKKMFCEFFSANLLLHRKHCVFKNHAAWLCCMVMPAVKRKSLQQGRKLSLKTYHWFISAEHAEPSYLQQMRKPDKKKRVKFPPFLLKVEVF
jgi:hypothetical protein